VKTVAREQEHVDTDLARRRIALNQHTITHGFFLNVINPG
jgi:hypothetical protein